MNIFEGIPQIHDGNEFFDTLIDHDAIRIERIFSNILQSGQLYDQDHDEWVILLQGKAALAFEGQVRSLVKGDYVFIKAHQRHRVESTSADALWLAVHLKRTIL